MGIGNRDHVAFCQVQANYERFFKLCPHAQLSCFYLLSTLCIAHVILDTRPSRFYLEYVEEACRAWGGGWLVPRKCI